MTAMNARCLTCALGLVVAFATAASAESAKQGNDTPQEAAEFIDRFVGEWRGDGTFDGQTIRDRFDCKRALGGTFLSIEHRSLDDASYEGHIYLGYDVEERQYELYSFNNFTGFGDSLPVRIMTGRRSGNTLITEEAPGERRLRYTFEFLDADTFRMTKAFVTGRNEKPFVVETFRRQRAD